MAKKKKQQDPTPDPLEGEGTEVERDKAVGPARAFKREHQRHDEPPLVCTSDERPPRSLQHFSNSFSPKGPYYHYVGKGEWEGHECTACRITGPFVCAVVEEGEVSCADGYVTLGENREPLPIGATQFEERFEIDPDDSKSRSPVDLVKPKG